MPTVCAEETVTNLGQVRRVSSDGRRASPDTSGTQMPVSEKPSESSAKPMTRLRRARWWFLRIVGALLLALVLFIAVVVIAGWEAFGKAPEGERLATMKASPQWIGSVFENPQPLWNDFWGSFSEGADGSEYDGPRETPPYVRVSADRFEAPSDLRVTWLGHSTLIIEIDGKRFLVDPVWGEATAPVTWLGPTRWYPPPLALEDIPDVDAILISHDHYDHLDHPTIVALNDRDTTFICPLGVGAHLAYWGVPESRILELDWWEEHDFGAVKLVMTPARHASGRQVFDQNRTLWGGFALVGPEHRAYYSGDTGLFSALDEIGERLGPFDVTMIEVGQYAKSWPDWHLGPEQAVQAHRMARGELLIPVHWGLFTLAPHGWTEPIERTLAAAREQNVNVACPKPGESVEPATAAPVDRWWPDLPWRTADEYPIIATENGVR